MAGMRGRYMGPRKKLDKNALKRLLSYLKKYKFRCIIVIMCIIANAIVQVAGQLFLKNLIDDYIAPLLEMENPVYLPLIIPLRSFGTVMFKSNVNLIEGVS